MRTGGETAAVAAVDNSAVWAMLARRWGKTLKAKSLSGATIRGYLYTARRWGEWLVREQYSLEPDDVRPHHVDDFIADIIDETSPANAAHHYRNLRVYFAWLVRRGEA